MCDEHAEWRSSASASLADEQVLVAREAEHQVAGADPDVAGVGRDADDGGVELIRGWVSQLARNGGSKAAGAG